MAIYIDPINGGCACAREKCDYTCEKYANRTIPGKTTNYTVTRDEIAVTPNIDRLVRQMLNNQLIIMGALDDLIMHGGGNRWAKVGPALTALHDGMASTSAILAQSAEPPKEEA